MIEVAMVFNKDGGPIWWPSPKDNSVGYIPDSRHLWDVIWDSRDILGGVCHTHPWNGPAGPSSTDITTFAAIEAGLGKPLLWPIVTMTEVSYFIRAPVGENVYFEYAPEQITFHQTKGWLSVIKELRRLSRGE